MNSYVVFDLETTGFSTDTSDIIEIGACKVENNEIVSAFNELVRPPFYIPRNITNITGISYTMVQDKDSIDKVLPRFREFVGDSHFLGFNLPFDYGFLLVKGKKYGVDFSKMGKRAGIDVLKLCRTYCHYPSNKLTDIAEYMNIRLQGGVAHRALYDATMTKYVYDNIKATYGKHKDIDEPRVLVDDNRVYGKVVNNDALSLD